MNKGSYDEIKTAYIMYQIFSAINYCHKNKIVNHDLSIENILVSEIKNANESLQQNPNLGNLNLGGGITT